jgi:hypothetical protein
VMRSRVLDRLISLFLDCPIFLANNCLAAMF